MRIRNYSERTIKSYIAVLSGLSVYYSKSPDLLSREEVKDYAYHLLKEKHFSVSTINMLISAWKILQVDLLHRSWDGIKIKRSRCKKQLPVILSREEVLRIITAPSLLKHRMLLKITYSCGLRRNEVLGLRLCDIDSGRRVLRVVQGKGQKDREVPIPLRLIEELRIYYKQFQPQKYLFEGLRSGEPYSASSFLNVVKKAATIAEIHKSVNVHVLRHCYATHLLESGVNLKRVQMLLGHSSMHSTYVYLHLTTPLSEDIPNLLDTPDLLK